MALVAGDAYEPLGVFDFRDAARTVVDELKLEAAGGLVVADDLDFVRALLVANEKPVLQMAPVGGAPIFRDRGDDTWRAEVIGVGSEALQGAAERDQDGRRLGRRDPRVSSSSRRSNGKGRS